MEKLRKGSAAAAISSLGVAVILAGVWVVRGGDLEPLIVLMATVAAFLGTFYTPGPERFQHYRS